MFTAIDGALGANVEFVLKEEFEECGVAKLIACGFLESNFEAGKEP